MKIQAGLAALISFASVPAGASSYSYAELDAAGRITTQINGQDEAGALYEAGSIGKFACTLAALRLADKGALDIDVQLASVLPELAGTPIARISLRQVLQSRSGIADGLLPAFRADPQDVMQTRSAREAALKYATGELSSDPGSLWSYDLVNWVVVQAVLEQVTGEPIAQTLNRRVLSPAGMGDSRIFIGEIGEGAQPPAQNGQPIPGFLTCAGGLATNASDLIALARFAHKGGLSQNSLAELTTIATPEESYSLGARFIPRGDGDARLMSWQTGSNGAYKSLVVYDPVSDIGFAAMTASGDANAIQKHRGEWIKSHLP